MSDDDDFLASMINEDGPRGDAHVVMERQGRYSRIIMLLMSHQSFDTSTLRSIAFIGYS